MKKLVCMPVQVPMGSHCFRYDGYDICSQFSNEGGCARCELRLGPLNEDKDGVLKSGKCLQLKNIV